MKQVAGSCLAALLASIAPADADALSYLSASGSDANNCSRTPPCRSITQALDQVDSGGTILFLDTASFVANEITKHVTIDGQGVAVSIYNPMQAGISVNTPGIRVVIRNLTIDGGYSSGGGSAGIRFAQGASLSLENVVIRNQAVPSTGPTGVVISSPGNTIVHMKNVSISNSGEGSGAGGGIVIDSPSGSKQITIENSTFDHNSRGIVVQVANSVRLSISNSTIANSTGDGIRVAPGAGITTLTIDRSQVVNNTGNGVMLAPTGSTKVNAAVIGSVFDNNSIGIRSFPASPASTTVSLSDSSASVNRGGGIHASGKSVVGIIRGNVSGNASYGIGVVSPAVVRIGDSIVNGNAIGLSGPVSSYGNNQLLGNTTQGTATPVSPGSVP